MVRILSFLFLPLIAFCGNHPASQLDAETCELTEILGVFPIISGMGCSEYAMLIGSVSVVSAFVFWSQVTK